MSSEDKRTDWRNTVLASAIVIGGIVFWTLPAILKYLVPYPL